MIFANRPDAGKQLAVKLLRFAGPQTQVLALPRGGVPVAYEVARALGAPLDVFVVRKLGAPGREELAIGAIAPGGVRVLNDDTIDALGISTAAIEQIAGHEMLELQRRESAYRADRSPLDVTGNTVILIDDGLATGASMQAAILALRRAGPKRVVVAVPVAPEETCTMLRRFADEIVCLAMPHPFRGVGAWYDDFRQVTDDEVRALLAQ